MATNKKRYYGIKFPFTANNEDGLFIDVNNKLDGQIASEILHVLLTPRRTRIRKPDFGTDLMKFVFGEMDNSTWDAIKSEAITSVSKYVHNTVLNDVKVYRDEDDDHKIFLVLKYSVRKGNTMENNELAVQL